MLADVRVKCGEHIPVTGCLLELDGDVCHVGDPHGVGSVAGNSIKFIKGGRLLDGLGVLVGIDDDSRVG